MNIKPDYRAYKVNPQLGKLLILFKMANKYMFTYSSLVSRIVLCTNNQNGGCHSLAKTASKMFHHFEIGQTGPSCTKVG